MCPRTWDGKKIADVDEPACQNDQDAHFLFDFLRAYEKMTNNGYMQGFNGESGAPGLTSSKDQAGEVRSLCKKMAEATSYDSSGETTQKNHFIGEDYCYLVYANGEEVTGPYDQFAYIYQ